METNNGYQVNDRVVLSSKDFAIHGKIIKVVPTEELREYIEQNGHQSTFDSIRERDPEFDQFPLYIMEPDNNNKPASFEQAKAIVRGITREQYDMLFLGRLFVAIDSDLIPEDLFQR